MNASTASTTAMNLLCGIGRVTLSLFLWTLGASAMDLRVTQIEPKVHRVLINFPADRTHIEELQRWVNAGHDSWCLDPQLVAASALRRISPDFAESETASLPLELSRANKTEASYTFHSLDGHTTYTITVHRHLYLLPAAGSLHRVIWIPASAEISKTDTRD